MLDQRFPKSVHKGLGLERVELGLNRDQTQKGAHQRVQGRQHVIDRLDHFLLGDGKLNVGVNLLFFKKLEIIKPQHRLVGRAMRATVVQGQPQFVGKGGLDGRRVVAQLLNGALVGGIQVDQCRAALGVALGRVQAFNHTIHQCVGLKQHRLQTIPQGGF